MKIALFILFLSSSVLAGGISSGGGDTLPVDQASIEQIEKIAVDSREPLSLYFKYIEVNDLNAAKKTYFKKLFAGPVTIYDILGTSLLEVEKDKPCYDAEKNEVDGSVMASTSHSFCISAFRIATKAVKQMAYIEVTALVAHELSHFLGTSEEEATELQRDLFQTFAKNRIYDNVHKEFILDISIKFQDLANALSDIIYTRHDPTENEILTAFYKSMNDSFVYSYSIDDYIGPNISDGQTFSFLSNRESEPYKLLSARLNVLFLYVCSQVDTNHNVRNYCQRKLHKKFGDKTSLAWSEYSKNPTSPEWASEVILNISNFSQVLGVSKNIVSYYGMISLMTAWEYSYMDSAFTTNKWWELSTPNPWAVFTGTYKVVAQRCTSENASPDDAPRLSELWILPPVNPPSDSGNYDLRDLVMTELLNEVTVESPLNVMTSSEKNAEVTQSIFGASSWDQWANYTKPETNFKIYSMSVKGSGFKFRRRTYQYARASDILNKRINSYFDCTYQLEKSRL